MGRVKQDKSRNSRVDGNRKEWRVEPDGPAPGWIARHSVDTEAATLRDNKNGSTFTDVFGSRPSV